MSDAYEKDICERTCDRELILLGIRADADIDYRDKEIESLRSQVEQLTKEKNRRGELLEAVVNEVAFVESSFYHPNAAGTPQYLEPTPAEMVSKAIEQLTQEMYAEKEVRNTIAEHAHRVEAQAQQYYSVLKKIDAVYSLPQSIHDMIQAALQTKKGFSEFIRNAPPEEKEKVYKEVIDKACEAQNKITRGRGVKMEWIKRLFKPRVRWSDWYFGPSGSCSRCHWPSVKRRHREDNDTIYQYRCPNCALEWNDSVSQPPED